jgi:hypothetical protein
MSATGKTMSMRGSPDSMSSGRKTAPVMFVTRMTWLCPLCAMGPPRHM